ncbi:MAG TPA: adenylosuccinate synthase [Candidatus Ratteibacteria bacterium]|uniref:Adenylosuccinate synthetase n=1 Tax=candidate division TA06 bacterium ADurb.Bin131 TaxID=1852827 RepID=A0A1V6CDI1_UNCT6|nr:MAG: Adenylosuccinate synthetase [candidate division TA06 bacterium ADurb.Bin131]HOC02383.1 adenylosuccinate synthase [bacterium]HON05324.1 adenylosuccinate synthase [bacterium]HRS07047.1 adenylosuccinate synthase [Candidatus Ratteibacteria bacterium]HRV03782.1 adenylosuccinate synthase [Candidatus Ratteibacteria bacterium]
MITVVIGTQWGDEGKGKIIDTLATQHDIVARYQGGANAGHTVVYNNQKFIFHLVPSGILHKHVVGILGNGIVIDPASFFQELTDMEKQGIDFSKRLFIAQNAHITLTYHKILDQIEDAKRGSGKLGTTGRGIGTTYTDKYGRIGIRVSDFINESVFINKLKTALELKNYLFQEYYKKSIISVENLADEYSKYREKFKEMAIDTSYYLNQAIDKGKRILAEGAQGTFLDIDFGTYPFVTASNPISGGACTGLGIGPKKITKVIGVAKAYTTRVGMGPFPTEINDEINQTLRTAGNEFGATTGRPRRCGWFDAIIVRYATVLNGIDELIITKLDVLSGLKTIKIGVKYIYNDQSVDIYPLDTEIFENVDVEYEEMQGWDTNINNISTYKDLPTAAKKYIDRIEELVGTKITAVSVGSAREQIIAR